METQRQLQGYATVRKFNGFTFPIPIQNMLLRDYCRKKGFLYVLPPGEMQFENCYMLLNAAVRNFDQIPLVGMCSLFMLPPTPAQRFAIYEKVFSAKAEIHFLLENIVLRNPGDEMKVEELYCLQSAIADAPKTLPLDKLGFDGGSVSFCG